MRNVLTLLAKSNLIQLGLTVVASAAAAICCYSKENPRFPNNIDNLKQISRRYGRILRCQQKLQNEAREQKVLFLSMLLGVLDPRLQGNQLAGKGTVRASEGKTRGCKDF